MNFKNLDRLLHQLSFRHRYISSGIKAAPVILRVSRGRRCVRPWTDNGLRIVDLWGNFSSPTARVATPFLRLAKLVAKKYYYRRIACEYAETCLHFRSRVLSQQCVRYITDIYLSAKQPENEKARSRGSPAREGTREIKFSHS